ncbi:MAG: polysaccharide export protein [Candidatus Omnitrophica bacterium]|jgi:polysaccharide export outer membrane protein|nr:polysaccharide export protein [Candidatus Omnitrophota bacterium]
MLSKWLSLSLVLIVVFSCSPVFSQEAQTTAAPSKEVVETKAIGEGEVYTLGKDDVVEIQVRNQPEFSGQFVVGPDGNIQYNFLGDVKAEGLTKEGLKEVLMEKLSQFVKIPEVSVIIAAYRSKFVYVLGEVGNPGKYPMKGDTVNLRETLVAAGLPTPAAALRRTFVITPDIKRPKHKKIDIYSLLYKGILKDNMILRPGDLVVVPSTVPSEINRALTTLLSPFSKAAESAALYDQLTD